MPLLLLSLFNSVQKAVRARLHLNKNYLNHSSGHIFLSSVQLSLFDLYYFDLFWHLIKKYFVNYSDQI